MKKLLILFAFVAMFAANPVAHATAPSDEVSTELIGAVPMHAVMLGDEASIEQLSAAHAHAVMLQEDNLTIPPIPESGSPLSVWISWGITVVMSLIAYFKNGAANKAQNEVTKWQEKFNSVVDKGNEKALAVVQIANERSSLVNEIFTEALAMLKNGATPDAVEKILDSGKKLVSKPVI